MEQDKGNLYRPHPLMINSGRFWRCKHGNTGLSGDLNWVGCFRCFLNNTHGWWLWHHPEKKLAE